MLCTCCYCLTRLDWLGYQDTCIMYRAFTFWFHWYDANCIKHVSEIDDINRNSTCAFFKENNRIHKILEINWLVLGSVSWTKMGHFQQQMGAALPYCDNEIQTHLFLGCHSQCIVRNVPPCVLPISIQHNEWLHTPYLLEQYTLLDLQIEEIE